MKGILVLYLLLVLSALAPASAIDDDLQEKLKIMKDTFAVGSWSYRFANHLLSDNHESTFDWMQKDPPPLLEMIELMDILQREAAKGSVL